jgi:hypothetical protein
MRRSRGGIEQGHQRLRVQHSHGASNHDDIAKDLDAEEARTLRSRGKIQDLLTIRERRAGPTSRWTSFAFDLADGIRPRESFGGTGGRQREGVAIEGRTASVN